MLKLTVDESKALEWMKENNLSECLKGHQVNPEGWTGDMKCMSKFKANDLALATIVGYIVKDTGVFIPGMFESGDWDYVGYGSNYFRT